MAYIVGNREKVWGIVHGDTYYRRVNRARHFYRRLGGYAIQRETVLRMLANGVKKSTFTSSTPAGDTLRRLSRSSRTGS